MVHEKSEIEREGVNECDDPRFCDLLQVLFLLQIFLFSRHHVFSL